MDRLIKFSCDDGTEILVETAGVTEGYGRVSRGEEPPDGGRFFNAIKGLRPVVQEALAVFKQLEAPDEISLEFGIKFGASAGVILARGSGEANIKVAVKWAKRSD